MLQLRNPWGDGQEWTGDWGDASPQWESHPEVRDALKFAPIEDGLFWISWEDFLSRFTTVEVCRHPMPGQRADFTSLEAEAEGEGQLAAVEQAIIDVSKGYQQLQDDPIDCIEHQSIVKRCRAARRS